MTIHHGEDDYRVVEDIAVPIRKFYLFAGNVIHVSPHDYKSVSHSPEKILLAIDGFREREVAQCTGI
jgi:hypothetical protein